MNAVGRLESVWRYPVKSMRGERLAEAFVGFSGFYGDRIFAFRSSTAPKAFPHLTAREQRKMLLCRPRFGQAEMAARPLNQTEAETMGPGVTPVFAEPNDLLVEVEMPTGERYAIDDPELIHQLKEGVNGAPDITLARSVRPQTDCRPISIFSLQTVRQLETETGFPVDPRRFRANLYVDLTEGMGYGEDQWIGRTVRIGSRVEVAIRERERRCAMITFDPDTGESTPAILRTVAQAHAGNAGVYGVVLVEGTVRPGDAVELLD